MDKQKRSTDKPKENKNPWTELNNMDFEFETPLRFKIRGIVASGAETRRDGDCPPGTGKGCTSNVT